LIPFAVTKISFKQLSEGFQVVQKLLYRSKQRGLLELDLLVGNYAEQHLPHMNEQQLKLTEDVLSEENPDLWRWISGQEAPPHRLCANAVFQVRLQMDAYGRAHSCFCPIARSH
jgi:succinate dehydrogenase flavin-adding protein (antitoxin of CptAB toxin-antitoxin module)